MSNGNRLGEKVRSKFAAVQSIGDSIRFGAMDFVDSLTGTAGRHSADKNQHDDNSHGSRYQPEEGPTEPRTRDYARADVDLSTHQERQRQGPNPGPPPLPARHHDDNFSTTTIGSDTTVVDRDRDRGVGSGSGIGAGRSSMKGVSAEEARRVAQARVEERYGKGNGPAWTTSGGRKVVSADTGFAQEPVACAFGYWDPETAGLRATPPTPK